MGGFSRGRIFRAFVPREQGTELSICISFSVSQSSSEASLLVSETNYNEGLVGSGRFASVILTSLTSHRQTSMSFYCPRIRDNEGTAVERKILLSVPQTRGADTNFFSRHLKEFSLCPGRQVSLQSKSCDLQRNE